MSVKKLKKYQKGTQHRLHPLMTGGKEMKSEIKKTLEKHGVEDADKLAGEIEETLTYWLWKNGWKRVSYFGNFNDWPLRMYPRK